MSETAAASSVVLLVCDPGQRGGLTEQLGDGPWVVEHADEMSAAMARVSAGGVDTLVLDLGLLPGDVALTVLDAARLDAPTTEVVVLLDPTAPEHEVAAYARGARCAVVRPEGGSTLRQLVALCLRAHHAAPTGRILDAVTAIARADEPRRLRARILEWSLALTDAKGASFFRLDDKGGGRSFTFAREHVEVVDAVAPRVLASGAPLALVGSPEELVAHGVVEGSKHGPALFQPVTCLYQQPSVLVVLREAGSAPFGASEADALALVAQVAGVALDRMAAGTAVQARTDELDKVRARLTEAEKSQGVGDLATGYAHQIQAPLQYLQAQLREAAQAVADLEGADGARESILYARDGADRVQAVIGELSLLGRSKADAEVPVERLVGIALRITGARQGVEVATELEELSVLGNVTHLSHALHQVLDNAIRFAETRVTIRAIQKEGTCVLTVADDGEGMPKTVAARVFEPFFTTRKDAPGMGLTNAKELVVGAGGTIDLQSTLGSGTTVVIELPLALAATVIPLPERFN